MLAQIRKFLNTRAARLFFVVLIVPFVLFGLANVARDAGQSAALATVGEQKIEAPEFQMAYRRNLNAFLTRSGGRTEPSADQRRAIAGQTLDMLIVQATLSGEVRRLGLAAPDDAVRRTIFETPEFQGAGGFDRQRFNALMQANGLTEARYLEQMREQLGQRQLLDTLQAAATAPTVLFDQIFALQRETRTADMVELPFSAAPEPPEPTEADLKRAYEDDPSRYSAPAFRTIKMVVLSPDTLARDIDVPEADIAAYFAAHATEYGAPEKRSVDVIIAPDEAAATQLATAWAATPDWASMEKAAAAAHASATRVENSTRADIPNPDLTEAAFAAPAGPVTGPVKSAFGWLLFRVTGITPSTERPLAVMHDEIKLQLGRERAVDQIYDRAKKLEDEINAGADFDHIPTDIGATTLGGTLDAQGNTPNGEPAPLPGNQNLRTALIAAAFAAHKGELPRVVEGPDHAYFALTVDDETAPLLKPFATVETQVRDTWLQDARRHAQDVVAAKLLSTVNAGGSLEDAATIAGLRVERSPPIGRNAPTPGVPLELVRPIFGLASGKATMVETPEGFVVARLASVDSPAPATDPAGAAQTRTGLDRSVADDVVMTFVGALRDRAHPTVNRATLDSLGQ